MELAAIRSALAAIGVQKKGGKPKPPGGALPRGPRKQPTGSTAGGSGTGRSTSDALGPIYARDWIKCYMCRQWGQHIASECSRSQAECDKLTPGAKLPPSGAAKNSLTQGYRKEPLFHTKSRSGRDWELNPGHLHTRQRL
jgi:hypothetical protein